MFHESAGQDAFWTSNLTTRISSQAASKRRCISTIGFILVVLAVWVPVRAQSAKQSYPSHFPYRFSNFPWWTDAELRSIIKSRIPGLGDEVAVRSEGVVRDALTAILREKGIVAEVQSMDPSYSGLNPQEPEELDFWSMQFPPTPKPSVEFSILTPSVLIRKVSFLPPNDLPVAAAQAEAKGEEGKPFTVSGEGFIQYRVQKVLRQNGYLMAVVNIDHGAPRRDNDKVFVDLNLRINVGPRFTVSSISADGGPLFKGKDLSPLFVVKPGDTAGRDPFLRIEPGLLGWYHRSGYLEFRTELKPVLDQEHAKVAYHLGVVPGPIYHLRQLTVRNLNPAQEAKVRELLGMKSGDPFNTNMADTLQQKCAKETIMNGSNVIFEVKREVESHAVDLVIESFN
jgi:hypothetical protein